LGVMINLKNIKKNYQNSKGLLTVFEDLNISFVENNITTVLGPSGCGKTTMLRLIAGLEKPTSGAITFKNNYHRIGMVFQEYTAFPWRTVSGNVEFGLENIDVTKNNRTKIVNYWLDKTGLLNFKDYYPSQLSGGMKQRLAFARCLAMNPTILLLDEPFGALDVFTREKMIAFTEELLEGLNLTVIFITHYIKEAILLADKIFVMSSIPSYSKCEINLQLKRPRQSIEVWSEEARNIEFEVKNCLKI